MQIRDASVADATALIELWRASGLAFRADDVAAELAGVLSRDPGLVLVGEDESGVCAAVLGSFDGRRGWVSRLATRPDRRGRGYAGAILGRLEERLAGTGCGKVNLLIEPDNEPVTGFYRRHGYTRDPLIFMEKRLSAARS